MPRVATMPTAVRSSGSLARTLPDAGQTAARRSACHHCWLAPTCLPARLEGEDVDRLAAVVRADGCPLDRGECLYRAGDRFDRLFIVRSGSLRGSMETTAGDQQVIGFHLPGEVVGFDTEVGQPHRSTACALERTSVCSIAFADLDRLAPHLDGLAEQVYRLVGREIAADGRHAVMMGRGLAYERVALFLHTWSTRMRAAGFQSRELSLPMRREDIASYLGLVTETASRAISRLHADGIIAVRGRTISVRDPEALAEVAQV